MNLVWFAVSLVLCCSLGRPLAPAWTQSERRDREGELSLTELSPQRIRGTYSRSTSAGAGGEVEGLELEVEAGERHHFLAIRTLEGRQLLTSQQHSPHTPLGISLLDNHFILTRDQAGRPGSEYLLPQHLHRFYQPALRHEEVLALLRNLLSQESVNATRSAAITELVCSKEASLLIDAAKALAASGVRGQDSPAAFLLYTLALRAQTLRDKLVRTETESAPVPVDSTRQEDSEESGMEFCPNANSSCVAGRCPLGEDCTGLCGPGCECWDWVCGNCCWNKMCYDHDLCCEAGLLSWQCMGILTDMEHHSLDCSKPYRC